MSKYRLTGNYGTFEICRFVDAPCAHGAFRQTGIMQDLIAAGWSILSSPDGEDWTVERWTGPGDTWEGGGEWVDETEIAYDGEDEEHDDD